MFFRFIWFLYFTLFDCIINLPLSGVEGEFRSFRLQVFFRWFEIVARRRWDWSIVGFAYAQESQSQLCICWNSL